MLRNWKNRFRFIFFEDGGGGGGSGVRYGPVRWRFSPHRELKSGFVLHVALVWRRYNESEVDGGRRDRWFITVASVISGVIVSCLSTLIDGSLRTGIRWQRWSRCRPSEPRRLARCCRFSSGARCPPARAATKATRERPFETAAF